MDLLPEKSIKATGIEAPGFAEATISRLDATTVIVAKDNRKLMQRITNNKDVLGGKPCIRGMRIRVTDVVDLVASGAPWSEILEDFPYLEAEDIAAALQYAADAVSHRIIRTG